MRDWWRSAVMYQVYPRSFADADGDGVGDLPGLISRLGHIDALGVDGIWVTPFQPSPQVDNGYDVIDYTGVDPLFGTMADLRRLLEEAHGRGLRVFVDLVPNHCSSQHPAFRAALAAGPGSPERELFHFARGRDAHTPPNNWQSVFGGGAWSRADPGSESDPDWYLHLFSAAQPDWNWDHPAVGAMFDKILTTWFERGIDGIRIDVAHALYKAPGLPDAPTVEPTVDGLRFNPLACDQEPVHDVYRRWRRIADGFDPPRVLVGEVNLAPERAARFARADELHQTFAFSFAPLPWDAEAWVSVGRALEEARVEHDSTTTWALENHDIVRTVTRYGDGETGVRRARAGLLAVLGLPGGVYLYQGQELGLPQVDIPLEARVDPMWHRGGVCRDGARVPLPWTREPPGAHGFSSSADAEPWLPQPAGWGDLALEAVEDDPGSTLVLARRAIRSRRELLAEGVLVDDDPVRWEVTAAGGVRCLRGERMVILVAMAAEEPLPPGRVLISSADTAAGVLPAGAAAWILLDEPPT